MGGVPGITDVARLARWLGDHGLCPEGAVPEVRLIAGGRSNLTYRLDFPAAGEGPDLAAPGPRARLVLRRPPLGHVLPTAHDMGREYRVLSALRGTDVPAPRPLALCPDSPVIGAPFYVMEWVEGLVLRTREDAAGITPAQATELSHRFIEMLAAIHGVEAAAVGLEDFGRPEGYLARQLARWQRQWDLSVTREAPGYAELVSRLAAGLPAGAARAGAASGGAASGRAAARPAWALVHGDFRLDNMLLDPAGAAQIVAVVDWEMSTLGDPLADLGLALVYWIDPGEEDMLDYSGRGGVTTSPGFLTRAELAERYARATGRDLSRLGYYMAFGCFKLAVVLEGIHARFLQHKTVGEGFGRQGDAVPALIDRAHGLLDAAR
jgi:aminoglycoside phosphotransferase (APT) family kinase protein